MLLKNVTDAGDISYAVGYGAQWDEFHDQVSAISTRLPYMTCIGNHERDFPNSGSRFNGTDSGGTGPDFNNNNNNNEYYHLFNAFNLISNLFWNNWN